jgi:hypothetical protein
VGAPTQTSVELIPDALNSAPAESGYSGKASVVSRSLQFLECGNMQFVVDPVGELPAQSGDGHQCSLRCIFAAEAKEDSQTSGFKPGCDGLREADPDLRYALQALPIVILEDLPNRCVEPPKLVGRGAIRPRPKRVRSLQLQKLRRLIEVPRENEIFVHTHAVSIMRRGEFRRLPVVDKEGRLVGLVSLDDILLLLCEEFGSIRGLLERETPKKAAGSHSSCG